MGGQLNRFPPATTTNLKIFSPFHVPWLFLGRCGSNVAWGTFTEDNQGNVVMTDPRPG